MSESVFLCRADDLAEGQYREFQVEHGDQPIWLVAIRHEGTPRAWLNLCPHQGRPLNFAPDRFLADDDNRLVCAHHGAVFDPADGRCIAGPCRNAELRNISVEESGGAIFAHFPP